MSGPVPGSAEWRAIVTASKAAAIIGVSPWQSPYSLWMEMKGLTEPREQTSAMSRGNYLEPAILAWWRDQHPEIGDYAEQVWMPYQEWAGATVDAAGADDDSIIVEAKSAARMDEWGDPGTDAIPPSYLAQVYFQLAVTGAARCYVPVIGPYLDFSEYVVEADAAFQDDILARCKAFHDSLEADEPPELDASVATYNTVRKQHADIDDETVDLAQADAHEFVASALALDAAESRARLARTSLLDLMGKAKRAEYAGIPVARRQNAKHGVNLVRTCKTTASLTPEPKAIA